MPHWILIPKTADGPLQWDRATVHEADSEQAAAVYAYGNCVVVAATVFVSDASHHSPQPWEQPSHTSGDEDPPAQKARPA